VVEILPSMFLLRTSERNRLSSTFDHNVTSDPRGVLITTRGQRRALMRENGLEYRKKREDLVHGRKLYFT